MAEKDGNQIKITIFGQEYSVKAPADPTSVSYTHLTLPTILRV